VDDLEVFLAKLKDRGMHIEDRRLEWEGGKHAWVRDPDGNRVELYEEIFFSSE
jgi:catechol 2,3-dioxygenase-like lactoylglutathione lyase family enzyme